jgi:iron complex transport system ATP-binding protein
MTLEARALTLSYDAEPVVRELSLAVAPGRVTALIGANASGKSTLLRGLARLLRPDGGAVELDGKAIAEMKTRDVARRVAILPQAAATPEGLTVRELVAQGRYPHQRLGRRWSAADEAAVEGALAATGIGALAGRALDDLSGGQRQHAWIAMALAQDTELLLLDEPTTYLDLAHQVAVLELVRDLNERGGRTIVMVLHDLNQAARYADEVVAIRAGRIVAAGPPDQVVTAELVREVFGAEVEIIPDPSTGGPLCVPTMAARRRPAG